MPGYPDWQRVNTRVQEAFLHTSTLAPDTSPTLGPYFVGNMERLFFSFALVGTGSYNITFTWYDDEAMTRYVNEFDGGISASSDVWAQSLPVQSQWLVIDVSTISGVSGDVMTASIIQNSNAVPASQSRSPLLVVRDSAAIGAGTFAEYPAQYIQPGPARVHFYSAAASWFAEVKFLDPTGTSTTLAHWTVAAANTTISETVVLPPRPVLLHVNNSTGSSANFDCSLGSMTY